MTAYVKCRRCGNLIKLVIDCMFEAPILFVARCDKCGFKDLYTYANVIEDPPCKIDENDYLFKVLLSAYNYIYFSYLSDLVRKYLRMINERLEHVKK